MPPNLMDRFEKTAIQFDRCAIIRRTHTFPTIFARYRAAAEQSTHRYPSNYMRLRKVSFLIPSS
jgi:hypothetical protein